MLLTGFRGEWPSANDMGVCHPSVGRYIVKIMTSLWYYLSLFSPSTNTR